MHETVHGASLAHTVCAHQHTPAQNALHTHSTYIDCPAAHVPTCMRPTCTRGTFTHQHSPTLCTRCHVQRHTHTCRACAHQHTCAPCTEPCTQTLACPEHACARGHVNQRVCMHSVHTKHARAYIAMHTSTCMRTQSCAHQHTCGHMVPCTPAHIERLCTPAHTCTLPHTPAHTHVGTVPCTPPYMCANRATHTSTHMHMATHTSTHTWTHCLAHPHTCTAHTQCCAPQHVRMHTVPCTPVPTAVQISTVLCTQCQAHRCTPAHVCTQCHAHQRTQSSAHQHSSVLSVPSTPALLCANRALHTCSRRAAHTHVPHSSPNPYWCRGDRCRSHTAQRRAMSCGC